jgi:hypothetical protein
VPQVLQVQLLFKDLQELLVQPDLKVPQVLIPQLLVPQDQQVQLV